MHDAVHDCTAECCCSKGNLHLAETARGETERGKMDQPQTHFEESAVFVVIGPIRHQDPLGYANNHS